jgi:hypothetical protein
VQHSATCDVQAYIAAGVTAAGARM